MKTYITILLCLLILIPSSLAIALTPAKTAINFEPNTTHQGRLMIFNDQNQDLHLQVKTEGELSEYISLETEKLNLLSTKNSTTFRFQLNFPKSLEEKTHTSKIVFENGNQSIFHSLIVNVQGSKTIAVDDSTNKSLNLSLEVIRDTERQYLIYILIAIVAMIIVAILSHSYEITHRKLDKAKKYIKEAVEQGHTMKEIKKAALESNWDEAIIKKLFR